MVFSNNKYVTSQPVVVRLPRLEHTWMSRGRPAPLATAPASPRLVPALPQALRPVQHRVVLPARLWGGCTHYIDAQMRPKEAAAPVALLLLLLALAL